MKKQIPTIALSVVALGGIAFGLAATQQKKATETEINELRMQIARMQAPLPDAAPTIPVTPYQKISADTNALAQLAAEVARLDAELAAAKESKPAQFEGWKERMERIKEEDPEAYAEIVKHRQERQQALRYDLAERTSNFMELDTGFMTATERENHDLLLEKMADVWSLTEQFENAEQPPNRETMRELFETINEARPLMDAERSTMFRQLANDLGYESEEAQDFSGYLEEIITATTLQGPRRGPGPGFGQR